MSGLRSTVLRPIAGALFVVALVVFACAGGSADPAPSAVITEDPAPEASVDPNVQSTPAPKPIAVKFTTWTKSVGQGKGASATVKTVEGAECGILVTYKEVTSEANGLDPKVANSKGVVTWKWSVGPNTTPGSWPIEVTCNVGDRTGTATVEFRVID